MRSHSHLFRDLIEEGFSMFQRARSLQIFTGITALAATALVMFSTSGCGKTADDALEGLSDSTSNTVETVMSEAGSQATASESNGAVGFSEGSSVMPDYVDPSDTVHPYAACTYSAARSACSSSSDTITFNGCTVAGGAVSVTGSSTEVFTGSGASTCTVPVATGNTVRRTSSGVTLTLAIGATLLTDTAGGTAWDGTVIPATGTLISNTAGTRTITIDGTHRKLTGPKGRTWFDHFVTSTGGLTVTGTRISPPRVVTGSARLYHNLAKYTANNTFNSVSWGSSSCCYPTAGSISSTFTGSKTGSTTLTFSNTCGAATFVDTDGTSSSVTLTQCN
jgi:hypothetical protein